jgi:hypothetical protein
MADAVSFSSAWREGIDLDQAFDRMMDKIEQGHPTLTLKDGPTDRRTDGP